jgi:hypothetical protein
MMQAIDFGTEIVLPSAGGSIGRPPVASLSSER